MVKNLLILFLLIHLCMFVFAEGAQEYVITETLLLDDFEDGDIINNLGVEWGAFVVSGTGKIEYIDLGTVAENSTENSKKVLYKEMRIPSGYNYSGIATDLKKDLSVMDLSSYYGIRFLARGKGRCDIKILSYNSMHNNKFNHMYYPISLTDKWKLYELPFSSFKYPGWGPSYIFSPADIVGFEMGINLDYGNKATLYLDNVEIFKAKILDKNETKKTDTGNKDKNKTNEVRKDKELAKDKNRIEALRDKRVAIVGIEAKKIDDTITKATLDFITNAFVNEGVVKVIDRNSIEKILAEQAFQMNDFTDTGKIIKIGKLAGAEYIVVGSISIVANVYYLNIKLISVETAEIVGSSISQTENTTGIFAMCNEGVKMLFK